MKTKFQKKDVLLIVDPQYDFFPGGSLAVADGDKIIPVLNQWLKAAQEAQIPVIVSRDWHPAHHISFQEQGGPWPPHCVQHTHGAQFHRELQLSDSIIIAEKAFDPNKDAYSAFEGVTHDDKIPLSEKIQTLKANRIWMGGLAFDYCVHYTALDARKLGYAVTVILPACKAIARGTEQKSFQDMVNAGVIMELDSSPYLTD